MNNNDGSRMFEEWLSFAIVCCIVLSPFVFIIYPELAFFMLAWAFVVVFLMREAHISDDE